MSFLKDFIKGFMAVKSNPATRLYAIRSWRALLFVMVAAISAFGAITIVRAAATITALKTDALVVDVDGDTKADPGDTLEYTVTITNSGGDDAAGVVFNDTLDDNTTLVPGSLIYSTISIADTYPETVIGNVSINSALIPYSVVTNDNLGSPAASISAYDATSAQGGQVTMTTSGAGMGQFTYNPPPGFEGTDTFTYTLTNSMGSSTATVSIPVQKMVWFVDNNASSCTTLAAGCGRLSNPFSSLVAFTSLNNGTGNNPAANDNIFIFESSTPYTGALALLGGQKLIGQDATATLAVIAGLTPGSGSATLPVMNSANATFTNIGGTVTLSANATVRGLQINSTTSTGMSAGAVTGVSVSETSIATTTGTAVSLNGTGGVLNFKSISSNGAANGISLTNTTGSFTVDGDGSNTTLGGNSSGGTIQNSTGANGTNSGNGVYLNNAQNVTIRRMHITNNSNFAISGVNISDFGLEYSTIDGTNGDAAVTYDEGSVAFTGLTGTATITGTKISGGIEDNFRVRNTSGSLDRITFDNVNIGANSTLDGNAGILLDASSGATLKATVQNSTFTSSRGDLFHLILTGNAVSDLDFHSNTLSNNHPAIAAGGGGVTIGAGDNTGSVNLTFNIASNTFRDANGHAVLIFKSTDPGTVQGTFDNNTIGVAASSDSGSLAGSGIKIQNAGLGNVTVKVSNNVIYQYNNFGVELLTGGGASAMSGAFNATVVGNTISNPGTGGLPMNGIHLNGGTVPGDTYAICADIGGAGALANTINGSGANVGTDFRLRQRQSTTVRLPGYAGGATDTAAVVTFLQGRNQVAPTGLSSVSSPPGGGFVGGAACAQPIVMLPENKNLAEVNHSNSEAKIARSQTVSYGDSLISYKVPNNSGFANNSEFPKNFLITNNSSIEPGALNAALTPVNIGVLPAGQSVTIKFQVTINDPLVPGGTTQVSNQGTVSGANFSSVLTDDPDVGGAADPTTTLIDRPETTVSSIDRSDSDPTNMGAVSWTVTFADAITGLTSSNFTLTNVGLGGSPAITDVVAVGGSPAVQWTVTASTGTGSGTLGLNLVNDAGLSHSVTNLPFSGQVYTVDLVAPGVTIEQAVGQSDPTGSSPITFTVVFSEPVTGFVTGDVDLSASTASGTLTGVVTGGPTIYSVAVSGMTGDGTVTASIDASKAQDLAGNNNTASTSADNSVLYDTVAPSVTINQTIGQSDPTNASPINFTVVFSEPVLGFSTGDVDLSAGTAPGTLIGTVAGGPVTYSVTVSGMTGEGTIVASIPSGVATDLALQPNGASASTDNTVVYDATAPSTTILTNPTNPTASTSATFTFSGTDTGTGVASFECELDGGGFSACASPATFNSLSDGGHTFQVRAIDNAGNVDATPDSFAWVVDSAAPDTTITGSPSDPTTSNSASFSFIGNDGSGTGIASYECKLDAASFSACTSPQNYSSLSDGSHTFQVQAIDAVGITDPTPASFTWTVDTVQPAVTINQASGQVDPTGSGPINFTVVFSEPVINFVTGDVTLSGDAGATTGIITEIAPNDGTTYNVAVTGMTGDGTVIATVLAGVAEDGTTNPNTASTSVDNMVTYDTTPPTVIIDQALGQSDPTGDSPIDFTVVFSEPVTGFDLTDVSISGIAGTPSVSIAGTGSTYTVSVSGMVNGETVSASIAANAAQDLANNMSAASTSVDNSVTYNGADTVFADVPASYWARSWIERLYHAGITGGCGSSPLIYCPNRDVNRAEMAVFILRGIHGSSYSPPAATGTVFDDVPVTHWAAAWIEQLSAEGITTGCSANNYCPEQISTTRSQMAIFLLRGKYGSAYTPPAPSGIFNDVPVTHWAAAWIEQLYLEGITSGCDSENYCPDAPLTRAQMAVFLVRTFSLP